MSDSELSDDMAELQEILRDVEHKGADATEKRKPAETKTAPNTSSSEAVDKPKEWVKSEEEIRLEKQLFGDKAGLLENLREATKSRKSSDDSQSNAKKRKPAWQDVDEEEIQVGDVSRLRKYNYSLKNKPYKEHLETKFHRMMPAPKWADLDREDEPDSDEEILRTAGFISRTKSETLLPTNIQIKTLKDLNRATYAEGSISSIQFHPTSTVAMVSGMSGIATLYSIDGLKNEKLHSIRFHNFPIKCARILPCGTKAMFTSKAHHYFGYDLMQATEMRYVIPRPMQTISHFEISPCGKYFVAAGRFGELHLFDLKSKELIHTFKQEAACRTIKFSLDSTKILASSTGSTISVFDLKRQRMMHSFIDDGCIRGSSLALSPDGKMLATGSSEGAVNIYDYEKIFASKAPQPEKTILNLTTSITQINFNHSSEILGMCSDKIAGAVKLVHFPTGTVFANFPRFQSSLRCIRTIEFSPSSGFLALGSNKREASLLRLKHFNNY